MSFAQTKMGLLFQQTINPNLDFSAQELGKLGRLLSVLWLLSAGEAAQCSLAVECHLTFCVVGERPASLSPASGSNVHLLPIATSLLSSLFHLANHGLQWLKSLQPDVLFLFLSILLYLKVESSSLHFPVSDLESPSSPRIFTFTLEV